MKTYKTFATFPTSGTKIHKSFKLLPDRYIQVGDNEPCPIEDYGNWLLSEQDLTEDQAFNEYMERISLVNYTTKFFAGDEN